jgi:YebC/PmpR family DNA-binding regulatory protein
MPKDNIERVIKRAAAEQGAEIQELTYEGYAPGGVALIVLCLTDNRNRTAPDIKHILEKGGGNMGSPGSVLFLFEFRSILVVETGGRSEDQMLELALEVGAEDVEMDGDAATIFAAAKDFLEVKAALEARGFSFLSAEMGHVPRSRVEVASKDDAARVLKLVATLEENDDVQNVYANYEIPDAWLEELG